MGRVDQQAIAAALTQARQAWDAEQRAIDAAWDAAHRTCGCGAVVTIWRTYADGVARCIPCATKHGHGAY